MPDNGGRDGPGAPGHHRRRSRSGMVGALSVALIVSGALAVVTGPEAGAMTVRPSATPAFAGDAGDPDVVYSGGTYFAFTTGTPLGNHIQALVSTDHPVVTGATPGQSTAPPPWRILRHGRRPTPRPRRGCSSGAVVG